MSCSCNPENPQKKAALELINQIIILAQIEDKAFRDLKRQGNNNNVLPAGISPVEFHLKSLKELVEKI